MLHPEGIHRRRTLLSPPKQDEGHATFWFSAVDLEIPKKMDVCLFEFFNSTSTRIMLHFSHFEFEKTLEN